MKKTIFFAIFFVMMAVPVLLTSCGDDDLIPEVQEPTMTEWVEPYHVPDSSMDDVKAYMTASMGSYSLVGEYESAAAYQLTYSSWVSNVGVLYSFSKVTNQLYSVVATELCVNKTVIMDYLNSHYDSLSGYTPDAQNIRYMFTSKDKSVVVSTEKISSETFNVSYTFVTQ